MIEKIVYEKKCQVFNTPLRIALSGKIASGKSTLSDSLLSIYGLERMAFAQPVKEYCSAICDYNRTKDPGGLNPIITKICVANNFNYTYVFDLSRKIADTFKNTVYHFDYSTSFKEEKKTDDIRKMLQYIGHNMREWTADDIWINCLIASLRPDGRYIVEDARYPNELRALKDNQFFLVRINIDPEEQKKRIIAKYGNYDESIFTHPTEVLLDSEKFDFYINGNTAQKNVLMKGISVLNQLDYLSFKFNQILTCEKTDDYRRNILMEFQDECLEDRDSTDYYSSRSGPCDSKEHFA